jgi:HlyD family secretion protein
MKNIPSAVWITLAVLLAAALLYLASRPSPLPVRTAAVASGPATSFVDERGVTSLPTVSIISMPYQGRVLPIAKDEGTVVKDGEVVASLDPVDIENFYEQSRQISEFTRQAMLAAATAVKSAKDHYDYALWWTNAQKEMFEKQTIAEKDYRSSILEYQSSLDTYNRSVREEKSAGALLALGRLFELYMARQLRLATLESPIEGTILKRHYSNPLVLEAGTVLLEIGDLDAMEITTDLLTTRASDVRVGQRVEIFDLPPGTVSGEVARIKTTGFTKVSSLGIEEQRVPVIVHFSPGELARIRKTGTPLGIAWRVRVRVYTAEKQDALTVPSTALVRQPDGTWCVFAVEAGKARRRSIQTGLTNPDRVEITGGLKAGDKVILAPPSTLRDGMPVTATETQTSRPPGTT